jgi:tRNA/tmRNA/rRNA uracil-C5-methylase (TrmA/RlmC/RlmD family)
MSKGNYARMRPFYTDRMHDKASSKVAKRMEYVLKPLPFQDDGGRRGRDDGSQLDFTQSIDGREVPEIVREKESIPYDVTPENRFEIINRVMCPLNIVSYENQMKIKYSAMKTLLKKFGTTVKKNNSTPIILDGQMLPCPIEYTKKSPKVVEYRNKDEFSIWPGIDGNRKTVGFFVGEPSAHKNVVCVEPDNLIISKKSHRKLASLFQDYLRNVSPLDVCTNFSEGGNWRRFVVRSNEKGEHMIIGQLHPQDLHEDSLEEEKGRLKEYFSKVAEEMNIKSAYFQSLKTSRSSHDKDPFQLLFGETHLEESLLEKRFLISPESFFQVNTLAAEVLYESVLNELLLTKDMTVIDLGSGTGTMSVLTAPHVRRVIGIEQSQQSVNDAKKNASLNGIRNITFLNGTVEDVLPSLADQFFGQRVVVIANPGRGGLRSSAISSLREMSQIEKLVYVACKPRGEALKNFFHLSMNRGRSCEGNPFMPVNAVPVDMFPQTDHVELIVTFERLG